MNQDFLKRKFVWLVAVAFIIQALFPTGGRAALLDDPPQVAESIRSALGDALISLPSEPDRAVTLVNDGLQDYKAHLAADMTAAHAPSAALIEDSFAAAQQAAAAGDAARLAEARSLIWTALLNGSYRIVEQAVLNGDADRAHAWLRIREYRKTTRFSRPSTGATTAVDVMASGQATKEETLSQVKADLLDTYQGRMQKAAQDLRDARAKGFQTKQAENAALLGGYFTMLTPAYREQNGEARLADAEALLAGIRDAVRAGQDPIPGLDRFESELGGFRAAPLSEEEKIRRAGQMLRFLSLVPVEYERGVKKGHVVRELEIVEATTFRDGAEAAFIDLQTDMQRLQAEKTARLQQIFAELKQHLLHAGQQSAVADPDTIEALVKESTQLLNEVLPEAWLKQSGAGDMDAIATVLDQMENAASQGEYDMAESARLQAYAILETGPEPKLVAFAPQYTPILEGLFWYGQSDYIGLAQLIRDKAPLADIQKTRVRLDEVLVESLAAIGGNDSPGAARVNSAIIVFREGLEAVLILAALLAGMQRTQYAHLRRPLWWGSLASLVASAITWLLARQLLLTLASYGERVEAVVSLMAVALLLLITNWFFHQSYWNDWLRKFQSRKWSIASGGVGQWIAMALLGFESIYREGFETVLFLQALVLEAGAAVVLEGVAIGMIGVSLVGFILFKIQVALPYKKMLVVTGVFIVSVLVTMVGNTVNSFQVVGWMPLHPIRGLELPYWSGLWFGIFPTWEGLILQPVAAVFVIGSYFFAKRLQAAKSQRKQAAAAA